MKQIYFLGPKGSFTELATNKFIKLFDLSDAEVDRCSCESVTAVINKVDTINNVSGIVPVENSIEGIVRETLDNLVVSSSKVMITGEVIVRVSHCLITRAKRFENIKTIISHSQALAQCNGFINRNFPQGVELVASKSTSEAVKLISDKDESFAAIGTNIAADYYNVDILKHGINDQPENFTKFVILNEHIPKPTGNDRTSVALSLRNKPGALVNILIPFRDNEINLCKIESRPSKKNLGEYLFFIDFDGHIEDAKVKDTIGKIAPNVDFYKFLGSYPKYCQNSFE